jgi:DHA3 family macrolide efflux protein-like MFS transporter
MRNYFVIFTGQAASLLGSELVQFALIWWLAKTGGSATTLALAALVGLLPSVAFGPFAGVLIDRWNRRTVMIIADLSVALATVALAILFAMEAATIASVYAAMFIRSLGGAFHWPAMQAATSSLVSERHLTRIAAMNQALRGLAGIAMPPLASLLLVASPISTILLIDIGTAVLAIATLMAVRFPRPTGTEGPGIAPSFRADLREGGRYVARWPGLALLIALIAILHFLAAPAFALVPVVVTREFRGGAFELAWMQSASGLGLAIGGLTLGLWGGFKRRIVTVLSGIGLMGACLAAFGSLPSGAASFALVPIFGAGLAASMAVGSFQAIQQAVVPSGIQGRVFAISRSGIDAMAPFGMVVAGPIADGLGLRHWYLAIGAVMAAIAGAAFFVPVLMNLEKRSHR